MNQLDRMQWSPIFWQFAADGFFLSKELMVWFCDDPGKPSRERIHATLSVQERRQVILVLFVPSIELEILEPMMLARGVSEDSTKNFEVGFVHRGEIDDLSSSEKCFFFVVEIS